MILKEIQTTKEKIQVLIESYKFRDALYEVIDLARKGNKYMQEKQPWILARQLENEGSAAHSQLLIDNSLHICLQLTANLAILINPFLPFTAKKLCHMMKVVDKMLEWKNAGKSKLLSVGYSLRAPELLFRKIEDAEVTEQKSKLINLKNKMNNEPGKTAEMDMQTEKASATVVKASIAIDDFAKIELRVGTITAAEKVEKADKLLKLEVDLGFEKRTIVSGIALHFVPADIIGRQVVVVANLAPRK